MLDFQDPGAVLELVAAKCGSQSECSPPSRFHFMRTPLDKGSRGVIAESVPNRTVSGIEECGAQLSQGRNLLFERVGRPDVSAAETNVFPTERSDVGDLFRSNRRACAISKSRLAASFVRGKNCCVGECREALADLPIIRSSPCPGGGLEVPLLD